MQTATVDCFFMPLTMCPNQEHASKYARKNFNFSSALLEFSGEISHNKLNVCEMAKKAGKSLQWIQGQALIYLMRPRPDIAARVQERVAPILAKRNSKKESMIAVHVRLHEPGDGRVTQNVSEYMRYVDAFANELASKGKPVVAVYFTSDHIEECIINGSYMSRMFPRSWEYIVLEHHSLGPGDPEKNLLNPTIPQENKPKTSNLMVDFLVDIEIMSIADAFIGSGSNIFYMVSSLRAAKQSGHRNHTCYIGGVREADYHPHLLCEGSDEMEKIWTGVSGGGYVGGVPFASYDMTVTT